MQSSCQPGLPAPPCKGGKGLSMGWLHFPISLLSITKWTSGSKNPPWLLGAAHSCNQELALN